MRAYGYVSSVAIGSLVVLHTACVDHSATEPEAVMETTSISSVVVDCDDISDIADRIDALEDAGAINAGQATSLRAKLEQAIRADDEGRPDKVAAAYDRLLNQIDGLVADGSLSAADAAALSACVDDVVDGPDPDLLFAAVAGGVSHACGLTTAGRAYCWGSNLAGELGSGDHADYIDYPVAVAGDLVFTSITAGGGNTAGPWGHTCALTPGGAAYCWGYNGQGQLGAGDVGFSSNVPVPVAGGHVFASISSGESDVAGATVCALTPAGTAYCWGGNRFGKAGADPTVLARSDVPIPAGGGITFQTISAGGDSVCGLTPVGTAYCWGRGHVLGTGDFFTPDTHVPMVVAGGHTFRDIDGGGQGTCGLTTADEAYCWGSGFWGQLGNGDTRDRAAPTLVAGGLTFASVSTTNSHTCGLTTTEEAYCWGINGSGQLGNGNAPNGSLVPSPVVGGLTVGTLAAYPSGGCALTPTGQAYCWGSNNRGQLGDGNAGVDSDVPVAVVTP